MEGEVYPYFNSEKLEKIPKKNTKQLENVKLTSEKQKTSIKLNILTSILIQKLENNSPSENTEERRNVIKKILIKYHKININRS